MQVLEQSNQNTYINRDFLAIIFFGDIGKQFTHVSCFVSLSNIFSLLYNLTMNRLSNEHFNLLNFLTNSIKKVQFSKFYLIINVCSKFYLIINGLFYQKISATCITTFAYLVEYCIQGESYLYLNFKKSSEMTHTKIYIFGWLQNREERTIHTLILRQTVILPTPHNLYI